MRFEKALEGMREGKRVLHRGCIYFIRDFQLCFVRVDEDTYFVFLAHLDCNEVLDEDWEFVEEKS